MVLEDSNASNLLELLFELVSSIIHFISKFLPLP